MTSSDPTSPVTVTYEPLSPRSIYSTSSQTHLPPLELSSNDNWRTTLRSEKLGRRESILGLKNIFGRSRASRIGDVPSSPRFSKHLPNARLSLAEVVNNHYPNSHPHRVVPSRRLSTTAEDSDSTEQNAPSPVVATGRPRTTHAQTKPSRTATTWDSIPLYEAYPISIGYTTLTTPSTSADIIIKAQEKILASELESSSTIRPDEKAKMKKKHRKAKSVIGMGDFTSKIYILVPSGYLLEYAGDGPLDRLPEKAVQLSKRSAVFASDLIPGRHWVLQVASSVTADGPVIDSSRSFLSRFRSTTMTSKRLVSNMLLVFDNAEEMDEWLAVIRRAIEALGGKQTLSETGKPRTDVSAHLREQPSQRTLLVEDMKKNSYEMHSIPPVHAWKADPRRRSGGSLAASDITRERSMDDISATDSMISHDGHQLDNLRGSQHRLSCISSGQRTMLTSTSSSPSPSPTMEFFHEDGKDLDSDANMSEPKLRPNASAIVDRRRSLQTISPFMEMAVNLPIARPASTFASSSMTNIISSIEHSSTPNFSVPSSRRYSAARLSTLEPALPVSATGETEKLGRSASRRHPPNLRYSRRLSMVADQPSPPWQEVNKRPVTGHAHEYRAKPSEFMPLPGPRYEPGTSVIGSTQPDLEKFDQCETPQSPKFMSSFNAPQRFSSLGAVPRHGEVLGPMTLPTGAPRNTIKVLANGKAQDAERCQSSLDMYSRGSTMSPQQARAPKRSSMMPSIPGRGSFSNSKDGMMNGLAAQTASASAPGSQAMAELTPIFRRSMPQLAEGPPPAPPPTMALPPLPRKASTIRR